MASKANKRDKSDAKDHKDYLAEQIKDWVNDNREYLKDIRSEYKGIPPSEIPGMIVAVKFSCPEGSVCTNPEILNVPYNIGQIIKLKKELVPPCDGCDYSVCDLACEVDLLYCGSETHERGARKGYLAMFFW